MISPFTINLKDNKKNDTNLVLTYCFVFLEPADVTDLQKEKTLKLFVKKKSNISKKINTTNKKQK
jgi:hypothetical protein